MSDISDEHYCAGCGRFFKNFGKALPTQHGNMHKRCWEAFQKGMAKAPGIYTGAQDAAAMSRIAKLTVALRNLRNEAAGCVQFVGEAGGVTNARCLMRRINEADDVVARCGAPFEDVRTKE